MNKPSPNFFLCLFETFECVSLFSMYYKSLFFILTIIFKSFNGIQLHMPAASPSEFNLIFKAGAFLQCEPGNLLPLELHFYFVQGNPF